MAKIRSAMYERACEEIDQLYAECGSPDEHYGRYTTTETSGFELAVADFDPTENPELAEKIDDYNNELISLARKIGKYYIGSDIWYVRYYQTVDFGDFAKRAETIIENFIECYEW